MVVAASCCGGVFKVTSSHSFQPHMMFCIGEQRLHWILFSGIVVKGLNTNRGNIFRFFVLKHLNLNSFLPLPPRKTTNYRKKSKEITDFKQCLSRTSILNYR
ncbi:hypothetical protein ATANTOWER_022079 [Ataeniobius toweri]|uniref:Uncharacterized protein n=1 Tax=Ataeniobius toweri TaxID=208326 RepID=A0ABU7AHT1_9TELE|nr:hypothetical protein [Ataeniobius toweri]